MNSERNFEVVNDEVFSLKLLFQYLNENIYGLMLLLLSFFIVYFVDYISNLNALILAMSSQGPSLRPPLSGLPSPVPGLPSPTYIPLNKTPKCKFKKVKKR
jgi:hypothetical protein